MPALLALAACGPGTSNPTETSDGGDAGSAEPDAFIAVAGDFDGFAAWESFSYSADGGTVHDSGPRIEYINEHPAAGAAGFPVGTIIVKAIASQAPHLFAMVKRGGGYNASGAAGWEWFDLLQSNGSTSIVWRGIAPPSGESYGGDPTACNVCHAAAHDNDSVLSPKIRLSGF